MTARGRSRKTTTPRSATLILLAAVAPAAGAQSAGSPGPEPYVSEAVSPWIHDVDLRTLPTVTPWKPGDPIVEVPEAGAAEMLAGEPGKRQPFTDPVLQDSFAGSRGTGGTLVNFEGLGFSGFSPPDVVGDVGPGHYIEMVNASTMAIWDKAGTLLAGPIALDSLWNAGGSCANGLGDPVVIYDDLADRWMLSEFASSGAHLCIYLSQTPDPVAGGWFLYDFTVPSFPDYPRYGVWPDAYYVSTFEGGVLGIFALDRTRMLTGAAAAFVRFTVPSLSPVPGMNIRNTRIVPADVDGPAPPAGAPGYFLRSVEALQDSGNQVDRLELYEFDVDFVTPGNSTFGLSQTITPAGFALVPCSPGTRDCIAQPGTTNLVDALSNRLMRRLQYRRFGSHEAFVVSQSVDAGGRAGVRWYELRRDGGPWSIHQQSTYSPDGENRWMGSIAMDGTGAIGVGYSVSGTVFPSIRATGRSASDPLGTLPLAEITIIDGAGSQGGSARWGDYSSVGVDPSDDRTFWYVQEYIQANGTWSTRVGSFRVSDEIFLDGFESGDTTAWSGSQP